MERITTNYLLYILSIFFFYCFQLLNGYIFIKFFPLEGANNYGEGYLLGAGILLVQVNIFKIIDDKSTL